MIIHIYFMIKNTSNISLPAYARFAVKMLTLPPCVHITAHGRLLCDSERVRTAHTSYIRTTSVWLRVLPRTVLFQLCSCSCLCFSAALRNLLSTPAHLCRVSCVVACIRRTASRRRWVCSRVGLLAFTPECVERAESWIVVLFKVIATECVCECACATCARVSVCTYASSRCNTAITAVPLQRLVKQSPCSARWRIKDNRFIF